MRHIVTFFTILLIVGSCNKDYTGSDGTVEIYLLKTVELIPNECKVNASGSSLEAAPLITNQEIIEYSTNDYEFKLTSGGIEKIKNLQDKTAFAVTVNRLVIYYGFFKPSISSSSCGHSITMDLDFLSGNKIIMKLGYPGQIQGITIEDNRNDPVLTAELAKQNKLR